MKRILMGWCLLLSLMLLVSPAMAAQKLSLMLDWFVNPDHAPIFVAQQQGFFKQQGLDVTIIPPADPSDPPKLVAVGKVDLALDYQPHLLIAKAQGLPLVQVGTLIATPLNALAVLQSSPYKTIKDLKGKTIGYSSGSTDYIMLKSMLAHNGLTLKDVKLVNVHYDLTQALLTGRVDAITGIMRNFEPIQMELVGKPARLFYPEDNGMPPYDELVFITNKKLAKDPRIAKFLLAVGEGVQYLVNHPKQSWQKFAKAHPELNNKLNKEVWFATIARFALRPAAYDVNRRERLQAWLKGSDLNFQLTPGQASA